MNSWLKGTAVVLVVVMIVQMILGEYAYANGNNKAENNSSCIFSDEDGVKYLLELSGNEIENCKINVTNLMTYDKKCVEYSYGMVTTQEYDCIGKKGDGKRKYYPKKQYMI